MYEPRKNEQTPPLLSVHNPVLAKVCARRYRQVVNVIDLTITPLWQGSGTLLVMWQRANAPSAMMKSRRSHGLHIPLPFPVTIAACYDFRSVAMPGECLDLTDENMEGLKNLYAEENAKIHPRTLRRFLCTC